MATAGKIGALFAVDQSVAAVTFTDEATTADATKTRYRITNKAKRYWTEDDTITVKKNGVVQSSGFTLERAGGVVVFDTPLTSEVVLVSGKYLTVTQIGSVFDWSFTAGRPANDTTVMGDTWATKMPSGNGDWSFSADAYYIATSSRRVSFVATAPVIVCLYVDAAGDKRFEGFAAIDSAKLTNTVGEIVSESITGTGDGAVYYHEG